jgi:hypothetical protein
MINLSISIVNFNTKEPLRRCLNSIQENIKGLSYEVIVVDNNSVDGSVQMLRDEFGFVKLIANQENKGATKAKNQSFTEAKGKYILILDSDIEILQRTVEEMFDFMENNPSVGILGPKVLFPNGQMQHSCNKSAPNLWSAFINKFFFFANLRYRFYRSKMGDLYLKRRYNKPEEFVWLGGMCLLVRKELIRQIGGMDENFFIYYDDTDVCLRAKNSGWKVYYLPSASVIHHMSKGVGQFSNFLFPKIFESELHFFRKHYGRFQSNVCAVFIQIAMVLRMFLTFPLFLLMVKTGNLKKKMRAYWEVYCLARRHLNEKAD